MNVIESNIIQSNITKILILAYEYVAESINISKTQIKDRKVHSVQQYAVQPDEAWSFAN